MKPVSIYEELRGNSYPGRGIVIGKSGDGKCAVTAYFIMGRSVNSRNRVFVAEGGDMRTQAFDPALLSDPSLVIYFPVRMFDLAVLSAPCSPAPLSRIPPSSPPGFPALSTYRTRATPGCPF